MHRCFVCDRASNLSVTSHLSPDTSSYAATRLRNAPHSPMGVHPRTTLQQESSKTPNKRRALHSTRQIIRATAGSFRWNVLLAKSSNHKRGPARNFSRTERPCQYGKRGKSRVRRTGDVRSVHMHVLSVICYLLTSQGGGTTTTPKRT